MDEMTLTFNIIINKYVEIKAVKTVPFKAMLNEKSQIIVAISYLTSGRKIKG